MKTNIILNAGQRIIAVPADRKKLVEHMLEPGQWLETDDVPANLDEMAVVDGVLVAASDEVIALRRRAKEMPALIKEEEELMRLLKASDYKALKFAEGELSAEDYAPVRTQRAAARARINQIQARLAELIPKREPASTQEV